MEVAELITALRNDMNKGFASIHSRIHLLEAKYHEAVEALPLMRTINLQLSHVLDHMEQGGQKAELLKAMGNRG